VYLNFSNANKLSLIYGQEAGELFPLCSNELFGKNVYFPSVCTWKYLHLPGWPGRETGNLGHDS